MRPDRGKTTARNMTVCLAAMMEGKQEDDEVEGRNLD